MYTITNQTNDTIYIVPGISLAKGASKKVDIVTEAMVEAQTAGKIAITGAEYLSAAQKTALTLVDNTGVATPGNTVADVGTAFSQTALNDNFAACLTTINALVGLVDALQTAIGVIASQVDPRNPEYKSVAQAGG